MDWGLGELVLAAVDPLGPSYLMDGGTHRGAQMAGGDRIGEW